MDKPYTQEAAMESIIVDEKYARVYTNDKRGSKRWTNSFIHPKYNQRISIIPQAEDVIWTPFAAADAPPQPEIPEPKSDFIQLMQIVEQMFSEQFELAKIEPPSRDTRLKRDLETQRKLIKWQEPGTTTPPYPPRLKTIPIDEKTGLLQIFNLERLLNTSAALLPEIPVGVSTVFYGEPIAYTMSQLEARMRQLTRAKKNIGAEPSIANRDDWYSDAVFAQQSFTGPNPTSITLATRGWLERFLRAAIHQGKYDMVALLKLAKPESMYMQDNSYFRNAANAAPNSTLQSDDMTRFSCASVTLFQLSPEGNLHPLAIVLDYRVSMKNSVCIFNQRLTYLDSTETEATDWPWRYAKMCHQVSDWTRHQLQVHLNDCHFVEEATIVAAQRSFPFDHIVYKLLEPHWMKTLSLNAAARSTFVPEVITRINGFSKAQTYNFLLDAYKNFNWTASYIPINLESRGFPTPDLDKPYFRNYTWARNMMPMWRTLYKFIRSCLYTVYKCDMDVAKDRSVECWYREMQSHSGGQMPSFPALTTIDELTNAVVMCIHIASPLHNSVNYLQCYYMSFVPAKPSCLMAPLPRTISELMNYTEIEVIHALPVTNPQVWLLSSQLPYLLSYGVSDDQTLFSYAKMLEEEARAKDGHQWRGIEVAAANFHHDLLTLSELFLGNGTEIDDRAGPRYNVMDPTEMAVSILI